MNRNLLRTLVLAAAVGAASTGTPAAQAPKTDAPAAFTLLKTLEGAWTTPADRGRQSRVNFELSANGSVLVEHYANPALPGGGHMMSAYHLDGNDLILTHYCIANNQPTLRAERFDAATKELQFEFLRATNLADPARGHMRRAKYRLVDANTFVTEWEFFENGEKKMTEVETFTRMK